MTVHPYKVCLFLPVSREDTAESQGANREEQCLYDEQHFIELSEKPNVYSTDKR